ncbi:MAG: intradiol ring-cleavage dioxygenase, partial [Phaeodactylibacter sp.]|nr:intradiol ring-cleavage dioxygenase [Phaeodactylibacter sp.]
MPLPDCEWCGAMDAPTQLSSTLQIAGLQEPGERLLITGTVFQADGVTPAPNILLYAYHTNQAGIYAKKGNETGNGRRHGHLRGWLKTD